MLSGVSRLHVEIFCGSREYRCDGRERATTKIDVFGMEVEEIFVKKKTELWIREQW